MSLAIQAKTVVQVLLADGWHFPQPDTFDVDAYEYLEDDVLILGGGSCAGVPSTGAAWIEEYADGSGNHVLGRVCVPLTSILAIRQHSL